MREERVEQKDQKISKYEAPPKRNRLADVRVWNTKGRRGEGSTVTASTPNPSPLLLFV
jgi:hypothetical protein